MAHLTLNQANAHLDGVLKLATTENQFLVCVQDYLDQVELDVVGLVRADTIKNHDELRALVAKETQVKRHVQTWRRGVLV